MYFTKIQGPRPARQGSRWVGEVIFNIFTFFNRVTSPSGTRTYSTIPANWCIRPCAIQRIISYFRSHHLRSSWMLPDFTWCQPKLLPAFVFQQKKNRKQHWSHSIWFPEYLPDSGLKWTYWFFWLLHNVLMSWLCLQLHPSSPIHPFCSCITHQPSHWILLFIQTWWWTCTT